jgi:hypothetical protein
VFLYYHWVATCSKWGYLQLKDKNEPSYRRGRGINRQNKKKLLTVITIMEHFAGVRPTEKTEGQERMLSIPRSTYQTDCTRGDAWTYGKGFVQCHRK